MIKTGKSISPKADDIRVVDLENKETFIDISDISESASNESDDSYVSLSIFSPRNDNHYEVERMLDRATMGPGESI